MCRTVRAIDFSAHIYLLFVTPAAGLSVGENIPGICCKLNLVGETQGLASQCPAGVKEMMGDFSCFLGVCFLGN